MSVRGKEDKGLPTLGLRRVAVCPCREMVDVSMC